MNPNPSIILNNLGWLAIILQTVGIIGGLWLFIAGIFAFKRYAETRTFMSSQLSMSGPIATMMGGVLLLFLPSIIKTALFSFWGDASPEHYTGGAASGLDQYAPVVLMFVRLIGVGSMIRGIILFSRSGNHHGQQQGTMGKAIIHIFGGILCIHILGTVNLLKQILDLS